MAGTTRASREEDIMTWAGIGILWVALSVTLPVLFGLRYTRLRAYQHRMSVARINFHRFNVRHRSSLIR
jgi:hypothetical protein